MSAGFLKALDVLVAALLTFVSVQWFFSPLILARKRRLSKAKSENSIERPQWNGFAFCTRLTCILQALPT